MGRREGFDESKRLVAGGRTWITDAAAPRRRSRVAAAAACWPDGAARVAMEAATEASATLKRTSRTSDSCCCTWGDLVCRREVRLRLTYKEAFSYDRF